MPGHRPFEDLRSTMAPSSREEADAMTAAMESEMLLSELGDRSAVIEHDSSISAAVPAEKMSMYALRELIRSFGAELEVSIALPDGRRVRIG